MKTHLSIIATLALALSGLACSSVPVQSVHDPEFDFSDGRTYRWGEQQRDPDSDVSWEGIDRVV